MIEINGYKLSNEECNVLQSALELYTRVFQGQFSHIGHVFKLNNYHIPKKQIKAILEHLDNAQICLHGDIDTSWKISSAILSKSALIAYKLDLIAQGDMKRANEILNLAPVRPLEEKFGQDNNSLIDPLPE